MDERTGFIKRLNKTLTEIKNFKTNQSIGGDSWVVYRSEIDYPIMGAGEYIVRFSPESNNDYVAVCKVTDPDRGMYGTIGDLVPDPNIKGKWWRPYQHSGTTLITQTFFVYSTVKGMVSVEEVTGQGLSP